MSKRPPRSEAQTRPTIIDVARTAGVSPATVSNALNDRPYVNEGTKQRVRAAVAKLGYTPNLRARRFRTGRADTIAIFSSMPIAVAGGRARLGFTMEVAAAAAERALKKEMALILVPPLNNGRSPFHDLHIDGALVVEPLQDDPDIALLQSRGVPVVSIGRQAEKSSVPFVDIHQYESASLLLGHLYEQSARNIALITGGQPRYTHLQTELAYRDFARKRGLRAIVRHVDEGGGEKAAYQTALALLRGHPELDGLFVSVDAFAVGAGHAAKELGLQVPGRLKLVTRYDGNLARECDPPLTALNLHLDQLAIMAVELLFEHLSGRARRRSMSGPAATLIRRRSSDANLKVG
jgi:DNA-binding LacI/PurR family transcriptional regulator